MTIVLRVDTDGCATLHRIEAGDLKAWQGLVGGYLEQIRPTTTLTGWAGYCDEEGMLHQLTPNPAASLLAGMLGWPGRHAIAGPVVFFGDDNSPDETDVPEPLVDVARVLLPVAWQDDLIEPVLRDRSDDRSALDPLRSAVAALHDRHLRYGWDTDASLVPRMCWLRRLPEQSALTVTPMPGVFRDNNWRAGAAYVIDAVHSHKVWDGYAGVAFTSEHWVVTGPVEQMAEVMQLSEARKLYTIPSACQRAPPSPSAPTAGWCTCSAARTAGGWTGPTPMTSPSTTRPATRCASTCVPASPPPCPPSMTGSLPWPTSPS